MLELLYGVLFEAFFIPIMHYTGKGVVAVVTLNQAAVEDDTAFVIGLAVWFLIVGSIVVLSLRR